MQTAGSLRRTSGQLPVLPGVHAPGAARSYEPLPVHSLPGRPVLRHHLPAAELRGLRGAGGQDPRGGAVLPVADAQRGRHAHVPHAIRQRQPLGGRGALPVCGSAPARQ